HRWGKASERDLPFTAEAISSIAHVSGGIPRVVNAVCDNALLLGFAEESRWIQKSHIEEVAADLHLAGIGKISPAKSQPTAVASQAGPRHEPAPAMKAKALAEKQMELVIPRPVVNAYEPGPLPTLDRYVSPK